MSKLGSSRQAIPASISLEHLRKPSIKPSSESESIFILAKTEADVVPMDIDVGKSQGISVNSGTDQSDPGASQAMSAESMSVDLMSVDKIEFTVHVVPS